jgi:hypothetical protein
MPKFKVYYSYKMKGIVEFEARNKKEAKELYINQEMDCEHLESFSFIKAERIN